MQAVTALVLLLSAASHGTATTLADAAFFEALRRAITPRATFALRTADVPPAPAVAAPPAAVKGEGDAKTEIATANAAAADDEDAWRARMTAARVALERDLGLAEAMQGRVNGLTSEMLARDDPRQRDDLARQRARALAELDRLTRQIEDDKLAVAAIEEDARKKGIPPGWIRRA